MKVILKKGSKGVSDFGDEHPTRAWKRALALSELHSCKILCAGSEILIVDAAAYYDRRVS